MEAIIGWSIPILGIPASFCFFNGKSNKSGVVDFFDSLFSSIALTVILIFISMLLNGGCIEIGVCDDHGDANMSYMFNAIFFMPAYLVIIAIKRVTNSNQ